MKLFVNCLFSESFFFESWLRKNCDQNFIPKKVIHIQKKVGLVCTLDYLRKMHQIFTKCQFKTSVDWSSLNLYLAHHISLLGRSLSVQVIYKKLIWVLVTNFRFTFQWFNVFKRNFKNSIQDRQKWIKMINFCKRDSQRLSKKLGNKFAEENLGEGFSEVGTNT